MLHGAFVQTAVAGLHQAEGSFIFFVCHCSEFIELKNPSIQSKSVLTENYRRAQMDPHQQRGCSHDRAEHHSRHGSAYKILRSFNIFFVKPLPVRHSYRLRFLNVVIIFIRVTRIFILRLCRRIPAILYFHPDFI